MKSMILTLAITMSISSYAQTISGGKEKSEPFTYFAGGETKNESGSGSPFFRVTKGKGADSIFCETNQSFIMHFASSGVIPYFYFSSMDACNVVKFCLLKLSEPKVEIKVDRSTNEIIEVILPEECDQDEWASARKPSWDNG